MSKKLFIYGILLFYKSIFGQTIELPKSIQSPNAASLGKYGDIPMDLSTGRANVNIPIYSLNEGGIALDVSLSYDTGGVRVNDVSGWVGQNWALNAGGLITRTVRGASNDELIFNLNEYPESQRGYYYQTHKLNTDSWNSYDHLRSLAANASGGNGGYTDNYMHDLEPDIFTFNFMGYSGKFFLGEDKTWKVRSDYNLKVMIDMNDNLIPMNFPTLGYQPGNPAPLRLPKAIAKIIIIDDKGNKFIFGGNMDNIEFSNGDFFRQSSTLIIPNSWYLSEVYNNLNQKVYSFEYERGNYQASFYNYNVHSDYRKSSDGNFWTPGGGCSYTYTPTALYAGGKLIIPTYLKTINGLKSNTKITFNSGERISSAYTDTVTEIPIWNIYSKWVGYFRNSFGTEFTDEIQKNYYYLTRKQDGITYNYEGGDPYGHINNFLKKLKWRKLNSIVMTGPNVSRSASFNYTDTTNQRLTLNSLSYDQKKYSFEYNNMELLPMSYLSAAIDHFGYFRGESFDMNPSAHYASREINTNTIQYGSLTKITYPLGGYTKFEYEPHTYSKSVDGNSNLINDQGVTSGLRIKKITDFSDSINKIEKEYLYKTDIGFQIPSGILVQRPQYYYPNWTIKTTSGVTFQKNIFSINSIIPLGNFSGSQIEYPTVIEKIMGNGYTKYSYTNYQDYPNSQYSGTISPQHSAFDPKTEFSYKRSKLKLKQYYSESNTLLKEEEYNYGETNPQKVRGYSYENYVPCSQVMDGVLTGNAYEIYYSDFNLLTKKTRIYGTSGQVYQTVESNDFVNYGTFGDNILKSKSFIDSNGKRISENYTYSFNRNGTEPYTSLTDKRIFAIVEKSKYINQELLTSVKTDYALVPTFNANGVAVSAQIFPQKTSEAKGNNSLETTLVVDKYDIDGHILKAHNNTGNYIYYYYGYNNLYPILKIEGVEIADESSILSNINTLKALLATDPVDYTQIKQQQSNIINSLPSHMCTLYTFKPSYGVSSIRYSSGIIEYYNYDSLGRLINVKDQNGKLLKSKTYEIKSQ
ncbi:hypothetical protein D1631_08670 [Chryseobacterium nematophagum]|uniref:RHS repeat protein n=1 Tax=Chryseobacterium nematophagum TaxID=2305228 RepID=A0A3M7TEH8_9FLAO|nr:hypothetical protein [Chryseobacterium nematophagum]RNA62003.1 hypothetical protein D1631_08670 [Chryseobacterium nematophagum]